MENSTSDASLLYIFRPNVTTPEYEITFCSINEFTNLRTCWLIPTCTVLTIISLAGNIATFVNILLSRLYKDVTYMCILLVALSDFFASAVIYMPVFVPQINEFNFDVVGCIASFWATFTPIMWSGGNLVLMAYERYALISDPLHFHVSHTSCRVLKISLGMLLIMSFLFILYACVISFIRGCPDFILFINYFTYVSVPMILIIFCMLLFLHCSKLMKLKTLPKVSLSEVKKRQFSELTIKVYLICITYVFGQLPFVINNLMVLLIQYNVMDSRPRLTRTLYHIGTVVMLANYTVNPFIYFLSFHKVTSFCKKKSTNNSFRTSMAQISDLK